MVEGDFVRVKFGVKDKTYNRKAMITDITNVPYSDTSIDKYEIKMIKSGEIIDCVKEGLELW